MVSLLTKPEKTEALDPFFARFDEPVEGTAKPGTRLLLADLASGLRKGGHYGEDIKGFFYGWGMVGVLVGLTWLWLRM